MALTKKQQQHPRFMDMASAISQALVEVAARFDVSEDDLWSVSNSTNKAVDEATSALLKAYSLKHT